MSDHARTLRQMNAAQAAYDNKHDQRLEYEPNEDAYDLFIDEAKAGSSRYLTWLESRNGRLQLEELLYEVDRVYKLPLHDCEKLGLIYAAKDAVYEAFAERMTDEGEETA